MCAVTLCWCFINLIGAQIPGENNQTYSKTKYEQCKELRKRIRELEGFPRGLYAGAIGWLNSRGGGEFFVGIRSALVEGSQARVYAGAGIVNGWDNIFDTNNAKTILFNADVAPDPIFHAQISGSYGSEHLSKQGDFRDAGFGLPQDRLMDALPYIKATIKMFEHVRNVFGDGLELLHDVHERVEPRDAIRLLKELERYRPFFIEDPVAPEANDYFRQIRAATAVPIAMGELFNSPHEWVPLIKDRLVDFIRVHLSQTGGFSVARKIATLAEFFNVRSAWHGPGDVSPVGHAANLHLDLAIPNFGIQEFSAFNEATQEIFPGCPTVKNGYAYVNAAPGWGVDFNEDAAKKYPIDKAERPHYWEPVRRRDGTAVRP